MACVDVVEPYEPGRFFRRELEPILAVLPKIGVSPSVVVVDGYVWLGGQDVPGLGAYLYEALERRVAVVGVAKSFYRGAGLAVRVRRGRSRRPLYVTAAGMEVADAVEAVQKMHGTHRIPTILRYVDRLCRSGVREPELTPRP